MIRGGGGGAPYGEAIKQSHDVLIPPGFCHFAMWQKPTAFNQPALAFLTRDEGDFARRQPKRVAFALNRAAFQIPMSGRIRCGESASNPVRASLFPGGAGADMFPSSSVIFGRRD